MVVLDLRLDIVVLGQDFILDNDLQVGGRRGKWQLVKIADDDIVTKVLKTCDVHGFYKISKVTNKEHPDMPEGVQSEDIYEQPDDIPIPQEFPAARPRAEELHPDQPQYFPKEWFQEKEHMFANNPNKMPVDDAVIRLKEGCQPPRMKLRCARPIDKRFKIDD